MWMSEEECEEPWLGRGESAAGWERHLAELLDRALTSPSAPEPQPSDEEVESVFCPVMASYYG